MAILHSLVIFKILNLVVVEVQLLRSEILIIWIGNAVLKTYSQTWIENVAIKTYS